MLALLVAADVLCVTLGSPASTPAGLPFSSPVLAVSSNSRMENVTSPGAPREGATSSNAASIPEEGERVLNHLVHLMEKLNQVPYLEALSRGSLNGQDKIPVIKEAVKELKVGAQDNATLSVTVYESPLEGGEALPTMQKEFIFVHPPANSSQDLASEAGSLHGHVSLHGIQRSPGDHESQGYRYGQWAAGGRGRQHEQHGRQSAGGAHRHVEDARARVHKERGHDKGGQAERKYRVRTEIEYFEREKFKNDEHDKLKAAHQSKTSTDATKGVDRFASQGHQSHQRHLGGGYAQGSHQAVGVGYAPVHVHGAPSTGGREGVEGGSRGFSQKDAQNHEEYHHQAGSQGFTDKDRGHQRAGWRERGYRIVAEKEYVDRDKHHDKGYGVDNQERGHRLNSQGQHGHKQGHDDIKKAKEHYSHGVHDSAHHEKILKNAKSPYGKTYRVEGSSVYPEGPRDHLSSSTDKVAELENGNSTHPDEDNSDASRSKKVIRIRVLSKVPDLASVTIGGQVIDAQSDFRVNNADSEDSALQPAGYVEPPRDIPMLVDTGRSAETVPSDPSADSELTPKKHFVPIEVLKGLHENVRGGTTQNINVNSQHHAPNIYGLATYRPRPASGRQIYNERSFEAVAINPVLQSGDKGTQVNVNYGTPAYRPASNVDTPGTVPYAHTAENGGQPYHDHPEYSGPPPSSSTSGGVAQSRENYGSERNGATEPGSLTGVPAGTPYTRSSEDQSARELLKTEENSRQKLPSAYLGTFGSNQGSPVFRVSSQPPSFQSAGYRHFSGNGATSIVHQQPAAQVVRDQVPGYPNQAVQHPFTYPYAVDTAVVVPRQEGGTSPAVHAATYPVYIEGTAVLPESYRAPAVRDAIQVSYSPLAANGYDGTNNPAAGLYPRIQEASEIVSVEQEKYTEPKRTFKTFEDGNSSPPLPVSESGERGHDNVFNGTAATKAGEADLDGSLQVCQGDNCTLPVEKSRLNQIALAKAEAIFRHFEQMKNPHRKCRTGACQSRKPPSQDRKCASKKLVTGLCPSKKRIPTTSPANGYDGSDNDNTNFKLPARTPDRKSSAETAKESREQQQRRQDEGRAKPSTMEEQAMMAADDELRLAKPVLEGMGYMLDADTPARKPLFRNKMVKIVKKDYFSQPLLLSSGGKVGEDGLWHAKKSAS
ncbi:hypothetical protein V5799_019305 [Amblyomma americanum]|uniref:Uncharacterized protein n=1 Tax=Amblyomma americanum TaxID=6943 RepID=A0AAQ4EWX4_AMBAM